MLQYFPAALEPDDWDSKVDVILRHLCSLLDYVIKNFIDFSDV